MILYSEEELRKYLVLGILAAMGAGAVAGVVFGLLYGYIIWG